ncbi:N-acetyltransferase [Geomicrobium sp. JCM 19039]|uniref:GNAT family N-acetyltransferase n=1 Tax=Geomicrobium sp. JCM 19039 TaxID=1460636 RepID=UPI00045F1AC1|nr:GNAT family N-acetyltransferase [Geomicrobium sp. JCM 19039]GAK14670.1 histone acetyltransferase HPA2 [Geomicrobium sp. JCM 19039]
MELVSRATIEDACEILNLQKLAYVSEAEIYNDYTIMPLQEDLESAKASFQKNIVLKYVEDRMIIGSVRGYEENGICYINKLMVHPACRNRGIGQILMTEIESHFTDVTFRLFTGAQSEKNIAVYEKLGYTIYKTGKLDVEDTQFVFMEKRAEHRHAQ